jgi:hypothetical protein
MYSIPDDLVITSLDKFYFTCPSYGFISPVLSIIDEIILHNPEIHIIVTDEQMKLFWSQLIAKKDLNWNLIYLNTKQPGRYRDVLSWLKIRPFLRKLFEDNFKSIENSHFYWSGYDLVLFSLVRLVSKKNTVVFLNIFYEKARTMYSLKNLILLIHTWLFYRMDVDIRTFSFRRSPQIWLSERFLKKLNIEFHEFRYYYNSRLLKKYNTIPSHYTLRKRIMWLGDDCSLYDSRMEGKIINCFKAIKSIIDENFVNDEVLFKPHPNPFFNAKPSTSISYDYEGLPSFMNSDFILANSNIQFILGGVSAVLATAARDTEIIAISYLNLMPFKDEKTKRVMVEFWAKLGDRKILFVNSLEELSLLLKEVKGL